MSVHMIRGSRPRAASRFIFFLLSALITAGAGASGYNLPEFGEPADRSLPLYEERELGKEVFRQIQAYNLILNDRELGAYIQQLGQKLVDASDEARGKPFRFFVINDPSINAFALPGGYIGIHTGLIRAAQSEAELAGVLAHEIAHVTQRHIARQMDQTSGWDIAGAALLLAALVAGGSDPDLVQAAIGIGMSVSYQNRVNFTRANELEADRLGIATLAQAGFDPIGMEDFFRRIAAQSRLYGEGIPELLRTHPYSTTRMAEARNRRTALEVRNPFETHLFRLMQVRAELAAHELASDKVARFPAQPEATTPAMVNAYGRSISLRALGRNAEAVSAARSALASSDHKIQKPVLEMELGRALHAHGDMEAAVKMLRGVHRADPLNHAATLQLAQWELDAQHPESVRQLLLESEAFAADIPEVFQMLAQAAGAMNEPAEAQYQLANWQLARGDWLQAIYQLRRALSSRQWDEYNEARLRGRLDSLVARAPERIRDELRRNPNGPPPGRGQRLLMLEQR